MADNFEPNPCKPPVIRSSVSEKLLDVNKFANINSGVYILNPDILKYIPKNEYFDMTSLLDDLLEKKEYMENFVLQIPELFHQKMNDIFFQKIEFEPLSYLF